MAILDSLGKRAPGAGAGSSALALEQVRELLPGLGDLRPYAVETNSPAVGLSLGELDLRAHTGATVLGLRRDDEFITEPDGETRLLAGDVLVLSGSQHAVREAFEFLVDPGHIDRPRSAAEGA